MRPPSRDTCEASLAFSIRRRAFSFSSCSFRDSSNTRRSSSKTARSSSSRSRSARSASSSAGRPGTFLAPQASSARSASTSQRPEGFALCSRSPPSQRRRRRRAESDTQVTTVFGVTPAMSATVLVGYARRRPTSGSTTVYSRTEDIGSKRTPTHTCEPGLPETPRLQTVPVDERTRTGVARIIREGAEHHELHTCSSSHLLDWQRSST